MLPRHIPFSLEVPHELPPIHTSTTVLWWFVDDRGRSAVCRLIERKDLGLLRMELEYDGFPVITETHRSMEALERRSREYYDRAKAEGWTQLHNVHATALSR